jgi:hypothetical protein
MANARVVNLWRAINQMQPIGAAPSHPLFMEKPLTECFGATSLSLIISLLFRSRLKWSQAIIVFTITAIFIVNSENRN